jgi:hypothetical protein
MKPKARDGAANDPAWRRHPGCRIPLVIGDRVRLNSGSPPALVVETGTDVVTIAWPNGEATFPPEYLQRV